MENHNRSKYLTFGLFLCFVVIKPINSQNHQPEVSSFESPTITDVVNLNTGDFVYSIPVLHIPGSYGGFDINLDYHGDISLNQRSSWVGLGWNINPGSIIRNVSGFPDDFSNVDIEDTITNEGENGYSRSWILYNKQYNSLQGTSHSLDALFASVEWDDDGLTDIGTTFGIHHDFRKGDFYVDGEEMSTFLFKTALNIATAGASQVGDYAVKSVELFEKAYNTTSTAMSLYEAYKNVSDFMDYSSNSLLWSEKKEVSVFKDWSVFQTKYNSHLNVNITNTVYGSLYLQNLGLTQSYDYDCLKSGGLLNIIPGYLVYKVISGEGFVLDSEIRDTEAISQVIHDASMYVDEGADGYLWSKNPTQITYDNFMVQGFDISGRIQPYRPEIGSVVTNRLGVENISASAIGVFDSTKVGFRYLNTLNYNTHHYFDDVDPGIDYYFDGYDIEFDLRDDNLYCKQYPQERVGFKNQKLYGGKDIRWYSHEEIVNGFAGLDGFIDYVPSTYSDNTEFRHACATINAYDSLNYVGIGGFTITNRNGTSYHFALPVYTISEFSETVSGTVDQPTTSQRRNLNKYANSWLLTAVTGPDYYDFNNNGKPDKGDWGFWMAFDYSKHTSRNVERIPANGYVFDATMNSKTYSTIISEIYYLDYITTNTHVASFIKAEKEGRDRLLKLDEIRLYSIDDFLDGLELYGYDNIPGYLKKVRFNYSYELAKNSSGLGLLTLKSLNTYFENDILTFPPYSFEYANNPEFNEKYWDGWGKYKNDAISSQQLGHIPSQNSKGDEWSLSSVVTPVGARINIDYERDSYSNVFGNSLNGYSYYPRYSKTNGELYVSYIDNPTNLQIKFLSLPTFVNDLGLQVGDHLKLQNFKVFVNIKPPIEDDPVTIDTIEYNGVYEIINKSGNEITLNTSYLPADDAFLSKTISFDAITFIKNGINENIGGGNRVSSIEITDGINSTKTKYIYTQDGQATGISSGFCLGEPDYCRSGLDMYYTKEAKFGMPSSDITYSKLTVLSDYKSENDYLSKTVYNYESPRSDMFSFVNTTVYDNTVNGNANLFFKFNNYVLHDSTSKIGRLNSVEEFSVNQDYIKGIYYSYDNDSQYGKITHGTILSERNNDGIIYERLFRTTIVKHPNVLVSVSTKTATDDHTVVYSDVDIVSDQFLSETRKNNKTGKMLKSEKIPAYTMYTEMGHKALDSTNANMLTQEAASYTYLNVGTEAAPVWQPIGAGIQTWKGDWDNYWYYDSQSGTYKEDSPYPTDHKVWRKHQNFVWKGDITENGTYDWTKTGDDFDQWFNFDGTETANAENATNDWVKTSEINRYNLYSTVVEAKDIYGKFASSKVDDNNRVICSASNASYFEFAYSGAEEELIGGRFAGDITPGGGSVTSDYAHTGYNSLQVPAGSSGFNYTATIELDSDWDTDRNMVASVWVLGDNITNDMLISTESEAGTETSFKAGEWTLLTQQFTLPSSGTVSFICNNNSSSTVYFDDFKVQPVTAGVSAATYDEQGNVTAILGNNNFATKYEYYEDGKLKGTYKETPDGFKKVSEHAYNYERGFYLADFTYTPTAPEYGDVVTFTASDLGVGSTYSWNFGDGSSGNGKEVTHSYSQPSGENLTTYGVTLTAVDEFNRSYSINKQVKAYTPVLMIENPTSNPVSLSEEGIEIAWQSSFNGSVTIDIQNGLTGDSFIQVVNAVEGDNYYFWDLKTNPGTTFSTGDCTLKIYKTDEITVIDQVTFTLIN